MLGIGRKKNLPNPSTNTVPSTKQDYMSAMGLPPVQESEMDTPKKKRVKLDPGGQLYRGEQRMA
jgi:hypothetical protein